MIRCDYFNTMDDINARFGLNLQTRVISIQMNVSLGSKFIVFWQEIKHELTNDPAQRCALPM